MQEARTDLTRQGLQLYSARRYAEAERIYRKLREQDPDDHNAILMLGLCRRGQGDLQGALRLVEESLEKGDGDANAHFYHGRFLVEAGRQEESREALAQALALDPNHIEARALVGLISVQRGDHQRAVTELKTALRAKPGHVPSLAGLARALVSLGQVEEAHAYAAKAVELDENNPAAQEALARVFVQQGHLDFAEKALRNALKQQPDNGELHSGLGSVLKHQHRNREALEHYNKAIERGFGREETVVNAAICLSRLGDFQQARRLLEMAHEQAPTMVDVKLRLAEARMMTGDAGSGRELLEPLPDAPAVKFMRARLARALGEQDEAIEQLESLIGGDDAEADRDARLQIVRWLAREDEPDFKRGKELLKPLLDRKPPSGDATLLFASFARRCDRIGEACDAVEKLVGDDSVSEADRKRLHNMLANLYDEADEPSQAVSHAAQGAYRAAPNAPRLETQHSRGTLQKWLDHEWQQMNVAAPDDELPLPLIVAGWPGSGRELLLAALGQASDVDVLDPERESNRLDALDLPFDPEKLVQLDPQRRKIARKRFLRGHDQSGEKKVVLEPGWWEASAIPALAGHFPGMRVLMPTVDSRDLELQWRFDGYVALDALRREYDRERQLWEKMAKYLPIDLVEIPRAELLDDPEAALERVCERIGIDFEPPMAEAAKSLRDAERYIPDGRWERYAPIFDRDE